MPQTYICCIPIAIIALTGSRQLGNWIPRGKKALTAPGGLVN
jgi:hypothetical protein